MKTIIKGKRISGMLTVLPENEVYFEEEIGNYSFPEKQTLRLKKAMGYEKHRIAKPETATSDMCLYGLRYLLDNGLLKKEDIGALLCVTLTPDHFVPHVSNILQGELGLSTDVLCMDVLQGCCGFLLGLVQGFALLDYLPGKKVVLCNADVLSHKVSKADRNSYPLIGDGATVTVLEADPQAADIYLRLDMDGTKRDVVVIPAGGSRMPCTAETAVKKDDGEGNFRSPDNLCMNGSAVFQFVQTDVPPLVDDTLEWAGVSKEEIETFIFHQPNRFMLRKLSERLGVPYEKVPMNIVETFGNTSGATVPMTICHNLSDALKAGKQKVCLAAFGSGLAWGASVMELGDLSFCGVLVSDC